MGSPYLTDCIAVYADLDNDRYTFEVCMYRDNKVLCDELFSGGRIQLEPQEYMLNNKTKAAFNLLEEQHHDLIVPAYIREAIEWISA